MGSTHYKYFLVVLDNTDCWWVGCMLVSFLEQSEMAFSCNMMDLRLYDQLSFTCCTEEPILGERGGSHSGAKNQNVEPIFASMCKMELMVRCSSIWENLGRKVKEGRRQGWNSEFWNYFWFKKTLKLRNCSSPCGKSQSWFSRKLSWVRFLLLSCWF